MKKDKNENTNHDDLSKEIKIETAGESKPSGTETNNKLNEELSAAKSKIEQLENRIKALETTLGNLKKEIQTPKPKAK